MSRTKRIYNKLKWKSHGLFYHPWKQLCMGNCPRCRGWKGKEDLRKRGWNWSTKKAILKGKK